MKVLTIIIPAYNSQDYLHRSVESVLLNDERLEIIIVNDGSKDDTEKIANAFQARYPDTVRAIHQENKGHGGAVNTGIANAQGLYVKILDSDDKIDSKALTKVLDIITSNLGERDVVDMYISNFVYDKVGKKIKKKMCYGNAFPANKIFSWNETKSLHRGQYILMHSVIYRTKLLKECSLKLPEHTFYVDNIFVFQPLPYVKKMYYIDVDLYYYFIGRDDQSVNEKVMMGRIDQQLYINKLMLNIYKKNKISDKNLQKYMINYLNIIMAVSTILLLRLDTTESLKQKDELWSYLKKLDPLLYRKIRISILGNAMNLPGVGGRKITIYAYKLFRRIYGFN